MAKESRLPPLAMSILQQLKEGEARDLLAQIGTSGALREFERDCQAREAARLLGEHVPRQEVRKRLETQGMSRSTAVRVIAHALEIRGPNRKVVQK